MLERISEHWLLFVMLFPTLAVLGTVAVLSRYVRLLLNILRDTPTPPLMSPFDFETLEGEVVKFRAFDGTVLRGMFLSGDCLPPHLRTPDMPEKHPGFASRGVIIFCHEYGCNMYSCSRYCLGLLRAGFDIFTFDFRSHGKSKDLPGYVSRLWCTDKEVSDVIGAITFVKNKLKNENSPAKIGLFGISRGGGAAIMAAAKCHKDIKAVLTDSAFSTDTTMEWSMKKWVHIFARVRFVYENHHPAFWRFLRWLLLQCAEVRFKCDFPSARKTLKQMRNVPVFLIHGKRDSYIRAEQAKILFDIAAGDRYLWVVDGAKHNQAVEIQPQLYSARTIAYFDKYLRSGRKKLSSFEPDNKDEVELFFLPKENCDADIESQIAASDRAEPCRIEAALSEIADRKNH